ncbi:girdin homolog [Teleopsis dalmanni]|uniref:girdin homolog n=1 Tax=Teleopsis dalmanni TaxID=139649 RepID=UPI0018CFCBE5|nr:girdin homolog [Teleopsis dalmanni]
MERKGATSEFAQKHNAKSEECIERHPHNLYNIGRPTCASGGDIPATVENLHCNSKNSSFQNLSYKTRQTVDHFDKTSQDQNELHMIQNCQSDASNSLEQNFCPSPKRKLGKHGEMGSKLKAELSKYKKELKEYNNTTKDLEEKYLKINFELNEMQQKHDRFVANRRKSSNENEAYLDSSSSTGSEYSLKRKYTQVFHRGSSFMTMLPTNTSSNENIEKGYNSKSIPENDNLRKKRKNHNATPPTQSDFAIRNSNQSVYQKRINKRKTENKENEHPPLIDNTNMHARHPNRSAGLKDIYKVLKNVLDTNQKTQTFNKSVDLKELQNTIASLQSEQQQFRNIIQQQQSCLHDYHSRCIKAQHIMQTQQHEIEKLNSNNQQLEAEITSGIDQLRSKIDSKLRDVAHLPQMMREEQSKYDKVSKENSLLAERLRSVQNEASQLKLKIEELGRRKTMTINRLKAAERDLKIFKNYNTALKHEKMKLNDELQKLKDQLENVQTASKRTLSRQREQSDKQRRELQKRVFELELKLSRSQNSTTSLIQERDSLIAELQTQLNTLVHNFEVSQKHIRVLRRHIYSMSGGNVRNNNRVVNESA